MIGRLRPGVSVAAATTDLQRVAAELERQYPEANQGIGARIVPASEWIADDDLRLALWVLLGAVSFLLLIACVNLANLLLARATRRSREYAISAALGAGRTRIVSRVLAESLFIGGAGAAVGLLLALGAVHLLQTFGPGGIPRVAEIGLNRWVLGFTAVVAVATGTISGVIPAMEFPSGNLVGLLREGDRGVAGNRKQNRIRSALIGVEVALSLVLLVGAGLMIRSFATLRRLDTGFRPEGRLTFEVSLPPPYSDPDQTEQFLRQFLSRVNSMPQVQAAGAVSMRPVAGGTTNTAVWAVENPVGPDEPTLMADWRYVTPGFFGAMGISLERGADFTESDRLESPLRVIISHALAERLWPGESPIGRRAVLWMGQFTATVVGVVDDMRERGLQTDPTMAVYLPYYGDSWSPVHFVVHATTEPTSLVPTLRSMLAEVDPSLPLSGILTMDQIVTDSVAAERFNAVLLTFFAAIALVLALAGVYGVTVYSVTRRTSEIGVRVALGANPGSVLKQTIWYGMRPALIGIGAGLTCAFGLSRLLSNLLFGIEPSDPVTYAGVVMVLGSAALLSCYLPARRALRVDPVAALRDE